MGSRVNLVAPDLRARLAALGIEVVAEQPVDAVFALDIPGVNPVLYLVSTAGLVGRIEGARLGQGGYLGATTLAFEHEFQFQLERLRGDEVLLQMRGSELAAVVAALEFLAEEIVRLGGMRADTGLVWSLYCMLIAKPFRRMRKFNDVVTTVRLLTAAQAEPRILHEALLQMPRGEQWLECATAVAVFKAQHPGLHPQLVADMFA